MRHAEVLVIGGSAGGLTAALTVRKLHRDVDITIIRKDKRALVPCGIPYIFETLGSVDKNLLPDKLLSGNDIALQIDEVSSLEKDNQKVTTKNGENYTYDKLILAIGSSPIVPPIPGVDLENVFDIKKDADYLENLATKLKSDEVKDVVVIGGGYIGVEFADELKRMGLNVTIVEMLSYCLQLAHDQEFCKEIEEELSRIGVNLKTNSTAKEIVGNTEAEKVILESGDELGCDLVLLGIGSTPNLALAEEAGLEATKKGIWVDEYMRTSEKDIYAVGDCAQKRSFFTDQPTKLHLSTIAAREARIAAANLYDTEVKNEGIIGVYSTCVGDLSSGGAGLAERDAREIGYDCLVGRAKTVDKHPGSMPNVHPVEIKLVFDQDTGDLIGGQVMGGSTTAELVNIIATLINTGATVDEIATLQIGTQPMLTASPVGYPIITAAESALTREK